MLKVEVPMVVSKVVESLVTVETMALVTSDTGTEVAPATPLMPKRVVSPVVVTVVPSEVRTEVQVLVETALVAPAAPVPEASPPVSEETAELAALAAELAMELATLAAELATLAAELATLAAELRRPEAVALTGTGGMETVALAC